MARRQSSTGEDDGDGPEGDDGADHAEEAERQRVAHGLDVRGHARHELAGLGVVVEGEAEGLEVAVEAVAQVIGDELRDLLREVALAVGGEAAQRADDEHGTGGEQQLVQATVLDADIDDPGQEGGHDQREAGSEQEADVGAEGRGPVRTQQADDAARDSPVCMPLLPSSRVR